MTQGAISQQIRQLERALGVDLFLRKHNILELTPEGASLYAATIDGLDTISAAVSIITQDGGPETITVSATDGMARFWLKPLINSFRATNPGIGFVVLASDADDTLRNYSEVDISVLCGNERCEVGEKLHFLFPRWLNPYARRRFWKRRAHLQILTA